MPRQPKTTDFILHLKDVGDFRFARPTLLDQINIRTDFLVLAGEHANNTYPAEHPTTKKIIAMYKEQYITSLATIHARHKHLCVAAPAGWQNLDDLELTEWHEDKLSELHQELGVALDNFRRGSGVASQKPSKTTSENVPVLVSEEVQPTAE